MAWNVDTGDLLHRQTLNGAWSIKPVISPDGRLVAVGPPSVPLDEPTHVRLFDLNTGRERTPIVPSGGLRYEVNGFSPDSRHLAILVLGVRYLDGTNSIWDVRGETPILVRTVPSYKIVWSPDGSRYAILTERLNESGFSIYDNETGKMQYFVNHQLGFSKNFGNNSVVWSPDGRRIAAIFPYQAGEGAEVIKVYEAATGRELLTLRVPLNTRSFNKLLFAGDGRKLTFTEIISEKADPAHSGAQYSIVTTTWDATPRPAPPLPESTVLPDSKKDP
jgi:WD40 repeat protein